MKATIETLRANEEMISKALVELWGEEKLTSRMGCLESSVRAAEMFNTNETIEDLIDQLVLNFCESRRRTSCTAEMLGAIAEKSGEIWNAQLGRYVKI